MAGANREDLENIFHYVGLVLIALGLCMAIPLVVSLVAGEWASALDLFASLCLTVGVVNLLFFLLRPRGRVTWNQGLVIVALSWLAAMFFPPCPSISTAITPLTWTPASSPCPGWPPPG
ncbi:MAG: hypothetical protein ACUVS1_05200 [Actinomycetota bacterium]